MTDQTIPAGLTRDQAQAVREWAERSYAAKVQDETMYHAARVLLAVLPPRPTLADMTPDERDECRGMQCDVEDGETRAVITVPDWGDGHAAILNRWGGVSYRAHDAVTPRPDLPRLEWPGDKKPAPALPGGWRLADHEDYGRGIVTNPTTNRDGRVYFVIPADDPMGYDWFFSDPAELTYLDQEADQ